MKKLLLSTFITLMLWGSAQASEMLEPSLNTQLEKGYSLSKIELIKDRYKIFTLIKKGTPQEWIYCKVELLGDHETECWRP
tara:strand:- start:268 stop:510 length:243 start_codon:yes stop_codon:yes gene_type:complete